MIYTLPSRRWEREKLYPDSKHVAAAGLDRASDGDVWNFAKEHHFTLVTKDSDFNDLCILNGFPPHVIWLRLGNSRIEAAEQALLRHFDAINRIIHEGTEGIIEING